MDSGTPPTLPRQSAAAGRIPLAVIVVDGDGLVSHWSTGARRLFGPAREEAVGRSALDLLPVSGALREDRPGDVLRELDAYDAFGPGLDASLNGLTSYPTAGRATLSDPGKPRVDVLWWAYPLVGPGSERLLVLAADARQLHAEHPGPGRGAVERIAPGFALHTEFQGAEELAGRLPEILPSMSVGESSRIVSQVLELGYPVLEFSQHDRVPVTPDWGVPRRAERRAAQGGEQIPTAAGLAPAPEFEQDLEYAAVRERLEFLNEVSGRIGSSLDLSRTIHEVSAAVVPRFTDVAGTYLREQVIAGEGFPDGPPDETTMWHRVAVEHVDAPGRWDDVVPVGESMPFPAHTPSSSA